MDIFILLSENTAWLGKLEHNATSQTITSHTSLSHTSQIQHTLPRRLICVVPRSHVHIPRGEFTVPPAKLDPFCRGVIDIFGSAHKLWCNSRLHPPHHRQQHVVLGLERTGVCAVHLPDIPGPRSAGAVAHAADAEVAVEKVEVGGWERHGSRELLVVALRVVRRDNLVLHAVVGEDFAAEGLEAGQVSAEGGDVEGVELRGVCDVGQGEVLRVPRWIVVDGVAVPVCRVGEGLAREVDIERR
jgi:hypothetical protein